MDGKTNFNYCRVIPRDAFNESKLLKCLGQLSLLIHKRTIQGLKVVESGKPFKIGLHDAGYLVSNLIIKKGKTVLWLGTNYNSKSPYPLVCIVDYEEIEVFNDNGTLTDQFIEFAEN